MQTNNNVSSRILNGLFRRHSMGDDGDGMGIGMDKKELVKALREAGATAIQVRMASILLAVNGREAALEFIKKIIERR